MRILVIEDDPVIGRALVKGFVEAGHSCELVPDGEAGADGDDALADAAGYLRDMNNPGQ